MENIPKIKGGKIYIGTPCYGGQCFNTYVRSLLQTVQYFKERDLSISLEIRFLTNESLITRGRNLIVAQCLADKEATHLLFIDADVSWHPSTIEKLFNADVDIIGAVYPKKAYKWSKLNKILSEIKHHLSDQKTDKTENDKPLDPKVEAFIKANLLDYTINYSDNNYIKDNLLEVKHIGTGFMLIKRQVLEEMCKTFSQCKFEDDTGLLTEFENQHLYSLFDCEVSKESNGKSHYLSEDYLFCKRWRSMGGKVYAEVTSVLTHTGTHSFQGNYLASLRFGPEQHNMLTHPPVIQDNPNEPINRDLSNNFKSPSPASKDVPNMISNNLFLFGLGILICNLFVYFIN
jgi:hypothetical protein